jgi:quinol monooxygenase YgiN
MSARRRVEQKPMSLLVVIECKVRADGETEFLRLARALAAAAATEAGTLRYQWFVTQKPGHYSIVEEYVNADAAEAHNNHVEPLLAVRARLDRGTRRNRGQRAVVMATSSLRGGGRAW